MGKGWWFRRLALLQGCRSQPAWSGARDKPLGRVFLFSYFCLPGSEISEISRAFPTSFVTMDNHTLAILPAFPPNHQHALQNSGTDINRRVILYVVDWKSTLKDTLLWSPPWCSSNHLKPDGQPPSPLQSSKFESITALLLGLLGPPKEGGFAGAVPTTPRCSALPWSREGTGSHSQLSRHWKQGS